MVQEIKALENKNTWTITYLTKNQKIYECKWVNMIKYKPNGEVDRYKARLVAKGYTRNLQVDYFDTFALVPKMNNIKNHYSISCSL